MALSAPTPVQEAGMALRVAPTRDWKREFISNLLLLGLVLFECIFVGYSKLCVNDRLGHLLVSFKRCSNGRIYLALCNA